jgi:putative transposase
MSDHLHLLVVGKVHSRLIDFVKQYKQVSAYYYRKSTDKRLWQRSFYDHILRNEESVLDVAQYIWENPIRKGLAASIFEYPYNGPWQNIESIGPT